MKRSRSCALLALLLGACADPQGSRAPVSAPPAWLVLHVENPTDRPGIVHFAGGRRFETSLMRVEHLGELPTEGKAPFLVLSGFGCNDCDINRSLYIHSPSDGEIAGESHPRYRYPGTLIEWDTADLAEEVIQRSRAFLGECVRGAGPVVLWVTEGRESGGATVRGAEAARVEADTVRLDELDDTQRVLDAAESAVRRGRCREIPALEQSREP